MELLFNIVLIIFFAISYVYVGATMPKSSDLELGAEQWPQLLITLLIILLFVNIYNIYKKTPADKRHFKSITGISVPAIVKSKLFKGIVIIFAYAFALEPFGFILATMVMFAVYAILTGQKKPAVVALSAILITLGIYFIFQRGLGIMLPRGYGFLRDIALFLESL